MENIPEQYKDALEFEEEIERVDYEHFEDRYDDDGQPSYE